MTKAKLIPTLQEKSKKELEKLDVKFEDVKILALVGNMWECLQAGKSEVEIHLINNQIKLVKPL